MSESESSRDDEASTRLDTKALLDRVAAAILEIERAKQERSIVEVRAARTRLAALHVAVILRRRGEQLNA